MSKSSTLARALGTGGFLTLRGVKYQTSKLRLRHFAEAKAFLIASAPDPLKELQEEKELFDSFPPHVQNALALKAFELREQRRSIANADASAFIEGSEGVLFFFWIMVRDNCPKFATFQAVLQEFPLDNPERELSIAEAQLLQEHIDEMSGLKEIQAARADQKKTERKDRKQAKGKKTKGKK